MICSVESLFSFLLLSQHLAHSAELCNCGNECYVKMSIMQGCQRKQIKPSPALHAEHTWWAHTHHATPHRDAGRCTKRPLTTLRLIQLMRGKKICFQCSTARPATAQSGGERRDDSEKLQRKSRQGMQGKKLVISRLCKVVRGGNQWE